MRGPLPHAKGAAKPGLDHWRDTMARRSGISMHEREGSIHPHRLGESPRGEEHDHIVLCCNTSTLSWPVISCSICECSNTDVAEEPGDIRARPLPHRPVPGSFEHQRDLHPCAYGTSELTRLKNITTGLKLGLGSKYTGNKLRRERYSGVSGCH